MKISQKFADTTKPKDIDELAIGAYLSQELYASLPAAANQQQFNWDRFKAEVDLTIDKAKELSHLNKFEELRGKFARPISQGSTLEDAKLIKASLEAVCYKLEKEPEGVNKQLFSDEVKSSTLAACVAGAGTNVQKILYAMQPSDYYQKYDYIQNLAAIYLKENYAEPEGMEVHKANELIFKVSRIYNIVPPHDTYADYINPKDKGFVKYLSAHLSSRQGVYAFTSFIAKDAMSRLPEESEFQKKYMPASEKLEEVCNLIGFNMHEILSVDDLQYKADRDAIIEASFMRKLLANGMIDQPDILKVQGKDVIEAPGAWFSFNPNKVTEGEAYHKLLDTKHLQGLTVEEKNIEDFLHTQLKEFLDQDINFDNALRVVIARKSKELGIKTDELDVKSSLFLVSDQVSGLRTIFPPEIIASMDISSLKEISAFVETLKTAKIFSSEIIANMSISSLKETSAFVKTLKKDGIDITQDINSRNQDGTTALMKAAEGGHKETMQLLLERGADVHAKNNAGKTALMHAADKGRTETAAMLIEKGADINAQSKLGETALMIAAIKGQTETAQLLIDSGADVHAKNTFGWTALMEAAERGHTETAALLLERGADVNAKNAYDSTALKWAAQRGHLEIAALLIDRGADVNAKNKDGETALMKAAFFGHKEIAALLLDKGADINAKNKDGATALILATETRHTEMATLLLEKGADVNAKDNDGNTALILAIQEGYAEIAINLIEAGADVNDKDDDGQKALMNAIKGGHRELATKLIEQGADVNIKDKSDRTALMLAVEKGYTDIAEILIDKGANLDAKYDIFGQTALMVAAEEGYTDIATKLIAAGANLDTKDKDGNTALICAIKEGYTDIAAKLIAAGADVNAKNKDGATALILAVEKGYAELATKLIAAKAHVNTKYGIFDQTALMTAAYSGLTETVEQLIAVGAHVNAVDKNGKTALMCAAQCGHTATIQLLIERGADVNAVDKNGNTALMVAVKKDRTETVKILIAQGVSVDGLNDKQKIDLLSYAARKGDNDLAKKLLTAKQTPEQLHELIAGISEEQLKLRIVEPIKQAFTELANQKRALAAAKLIESFPTSDRAQLQELRELIQQNQGLNVLRNDPNAAPKIKAIDGATKQLLDR